MTTSITESVKISFHPIISVVVCTYNRVNLLADALHTLCNQTLDTSDYEVIVVDNNSTDDTREVVDEFCYRFTNVRYCFEPQQGLSHARNRGWREAKGQYIAYTDDDCMMPEQWLEVAEEIIEQVSPDVFGGPYYAFHTTPKPRWFKDSYGSHELDKKARTLQENEYLDGANIFLRRSLLESLSGFDTSLGMSGTRVGYGEETALLQLIRTMEPAQLVYFDPRLYVYHLVPPQKMSMYWIIRQRFAAGRYSFRTFQGGNPLPLGRLQLIVGVVFALFALVGDSARGVFHRDRAQYPYPQNFFYEESFRHLQRLGMLYEQYRQMAQQSEDQGLERKVI
ncbi:MAG: glycosyltransferase [Candidatus Thorarchaeota archaeon]|jgi:glycosyltransferase involved in cell wall biosynthesis